MNSRLRTRLSILVGMLAIAAAMLLLSLAVWESTLFNRLYPYILLLNLVALALLCALIGVNVWRLIRQYRAGAAGARLRVRLVKVFVLLALAPTAAIYLFSVQLLNGGIDSWYDVRVQQALENSRELARTVVNERKKGLLREARRLAEAINEGAEAEIELLLERYLEASGAYEVSVIEPSGRILAFSNSDPGLLVPAPPDEAVLSRVRQGVAYHELEPHARLGQAIRIVLPLARPIPLRLIGGGGGAELQERAVQTLHAVPERIAALLEDVERTAAQYRQLEYLRTPLRQSFTLTLSLVLLLSFLAAAWAAFLAARRLAAPIRDLAEGTRAVAAGIYDRELPTAANDELGFLVRSFNAMTRRLNAARAEIRAGQEQTESERAWLEAVLSHLSSGVLALDTGHRLIRVNRAALAILDATLEESLDETLEEAALRHPLLRPFVDALLPHLGDWALEWSEEIVIARPGGRRILFCRGAWLPGAVERAGQVIVFDDVTDRIDAQRNAAWSEVARRLAHEIKNPLTPIQLSAERLRQKCLGAIPPEQEAVVERSTHTIIRQVEAMKKMVEAFSEYARAPELALAPLDIAPLAREVVDLYRGVGARLRLELEEGLPRLHADADRLRQALHNLIKNGLEAGVDDERDAPQGHGDSGGDEADRAARGREIEVRIRALRDPARIELRVSDNGPGIPAVATLFEPYVTHKPKGSGLGLAIVKRIVEEHGGSVRAENRAEGGACFIIELSAMEEREQSQ